MGRRVNLEVKVFCDGKLILTADNENARNLLEGLKIGCFRLDISPYLKGRFTKEDVERRVVEDEEGCLISQVKIYLLQLEE